MFLGVAWGDWLNDPSIYKWAVAAGAWVVILQIIKLHAVWCKKKNYMLYTELLHLHTSFYLKKRGINIDAYTCCENTVKFMCFKEVLNFWNFESFLLSNAKHEC